MFSRRQRDVLELAAVGLADKEIARTLGVSFATVRTHVSAARAKVGSRTRTAAVAAWLLNEASVEQVSWVRARLGEVA